MTRSRTLGGKTAAAYATVYVAWGSTYYAIKVAVGLMSPAEFGFLRFVLSGAMLLAVWLIRRRPDRRRVTAAQLLCAAGIGVVLLGFGNGCLAYSERFIPSGVTALIVGCTPLLFALANWATGGTRITLSQVLGGLLAFSGVAVLAMAGSATGAAAYPRGWIAVLMLGSLSWVSSSIASKHVPMPEDAVLTSAVEMLAASLAFLVFGLARGEFSPSDPARIPATAWEAIVFLAVVGSCVGFTAYTWLLHREPANRVASYAFVNPAVAMLIGVFIGGESMTRSIASALALILSGVALSMLGGRGPEASGAEGGGGAV